MSHEHHHHEQEECSCGHEHHHHEHSHEHHHHDHEACSCGCGHNHGHEHHHHEHDHKHHHHEHDHEHNHIEDKLAHVSSSTKKKFYIIENLGCANCAAKMERKINELEEVEAATITFATKQLCVASNHQDGLLPKLQEICASIESEVIVRPKEEEKAIEKEDNKKDFIEIGLGVVFFAGGILIGKIWPIGVMLLHVLGYLILGREIVIKAAKNLIKGQVFDENFLMSIATIAAFCISEHTEAVGVMLFFRIGELFEHIAVEKSRNQIMEAVDMRPEVVNMVQGRDVITIPAKEANGQIFSFNIDNCFCIV